jgi:hypothetical protein
MKHIPVIGTDRPCLVDDETYPWLSTFKWYLAGRNNRAKGGTGAYPYTWLVSGENKLYRLKITRLLMPPKQGLVVDHINRDSMDNRWENLRYLTSKENLANRGLRADNTTGVEGVQKSTYKDRYSVRVRVNGQSYWVGNFDTVEDGAKAKEQFLQMAKLSPQLLPPRVRNPSGVRGISLRKGKWAVRKMVNYKSYFIGEFKTKEEAVEALNNFTP